MSRREKDVSTSKFFKRTGIFVLILCIFAAILFAAEYVILKDFQSSYDNNSEKPAWVDSQKAFEEYADSLSADDWTALWYESNPNCLDKRSAVSGIMENLFCNGDISFYRASGYSDEKPIYLISNSNGPLADVYLEKSSTEEWIVASVDFRFSGEYEAEIDLPSGCAVYCNGTLLDDSFHDEGKDNYYVKEYIEDIDNRVVWYTWKVSGQLTPPEFSYEAPEGRDFYTNDLGLLTISLPDGEMQELYDLADKFFDAFHRYVMYGYFSDQTYARMAAANTVPDSQAYNSVFEAYDAIKHAPCYGSYDNELTLSPVICWGDNAYSIDINYHTDARHIAEVTEFDGVYRLYFLDLGEGYGIYALQMQ